MSEICDLTYAVNELISRVQALEAAARDRGDRVDRLERAARAPRAPAWPAHPPALTQPRSVHTPFDYGH